MNKLVYILLAIAFSYGCKKPYDPVITANYTNILVVEGLINTGGTDSTVINLSRTGVVGNNKIGIPEAKAVITIENAQGAITTLNEIARGTYASPPAGLDNTKQYRLRIKTSNGKTYLSDLVDVKETPLIDSVGYTIQNNSIQVYANTHDPKNNTHYYKYTYRETWQFNAKYSSDYISVDTDIIPRIPSKQIYHCYSSDSSSHTIINSTAALTQDVAFQVPIINIPATSEKIETKYSILLTQQALTKEAYSFYENLKKNTEDLGSIFDAQPSQLIGNIHNLADASEPVIGYISAGTKRQKRIYILKTALPQNFLTMYPYGCQVDSAYNGPIPPIPVHVFYTIKVLLQPPPVGAGIPIAAFGVSPTAIPKTPSVLWGDGMNGYLFSTVPCTDCTIRGTTTQPAFWK